VAGVYGIEAAAGCHYFAQLAANLAEFFQRDDFGTPVFFN
jgi:hypothetical protein